MSFPPVNFSLLGRGGEAGFRCFRGRSAVSEDLADCNPVLRLTNSGGEFESSKRLQGSKPDNPPIAIGFVFWVMNLGHFLVAGDLSVCKRWMDNLPTAFDLNE